MEYVIGIDPGLSGGLAFYNPEHLVVFPTPVVQVEFIKKGKKRKRNEMILAVACNHILEFTDIKFAYIEHVAAMGGQGVTSMFRFGQNFGQWQGILGGLRISTGLVRPQAWKKYHNLIGTDKDASLDLARELFPDNLTSFKLKKHDGLAEASLIAKYAWEQKYHPLLTCPDK